MSSSELSNALNPHIVPQRPRRAHLPRPASAHATPSIHHAQVPQSSAPHRSELELAITLPPSPPPPSPLLECVFCLLPCSMLLTLNTVKSCPGTSTTGKAFAECPTRGPTIVSSNCQCPKCCLCRKQASHRLGAGTGGEDCPGAGPDGATSFERAGGASYPKGIHHRTLQPPAPSCTPGYLH